VKFRNASLRKATADCASVSRAIGFAVELGYFSRDFTCETFVVLVRSVVTCNCASWEMKFVTAS
jgi:hypothetical protein